MHFKVLWLMLLQCYRLVTICLKYEKHTYCRSSVFMVASLHHWIHWITFVLLIAYKRQATVHHFHYELGFLLFMSKYHILIYGCKYALEKCDIWRIVYLCIVGYAHIVDQLCCHTVQVFLCTVVEPNIIQVQIWCHNHNIQLFIYLDRCAENLCVVLNYLRSC